MPRSRLPGTSPSRLPKFATLPGPQAPPQQPKSSPSVFASVGTEGEVPAVMLTRRPWAVLQAFEVGGVHHRDGLGTLPNDISSLPVRPAEARLVTTYLFSVSTRPRRESVHAGDHLLIKVSYRALVRGSMAASTGSFNVARG